MPSFISALHIILWDFSFVIQIFKQILNAFFSLIHLVLIFLLSFTSALAAFLQYLLFDVVFVHSFQLFSPYDAFYLLLSQSSFFKYLPFSKQFFVLPNAINLLDSSMLPHLNQFLNAIVLIHSIYPLVRMALQFVTGRIHFLLLISSSISIIILFNHVSLLPLEENQNYDLVVMTSINNTKIRAAIWLLLLIPSAFEKIGLKRKKYFHLSFFLHYFNEIVLDFQFY